MLGMFTSARSTLIRVILGIVLEIETATNVISNDDFPVDAKKPCFFVLFTESSWKFALHPNKSSSKVCTILSRYKNINWKKPCNLTKPIQDCQSWENWQMCNKENFHSSELYSNWRLSLGSHYYYYFFFLFKSLQTKMRKNLNIEVELMNDAEPK